jgi:hypothetical protein
MDANKTRNISCRIFLGSLNGSLRISDKIELSEIANADFKKMQLISPIEQEWLIDILLRVAS